MKLNCTLRKELLMNNMTGNMMVQNGTKNGFVPEFKLAVYDDGSDNHNQLANWRDVAKIEGFILNDELENMITNLIFTGLMIKYVGYNFILGIARTDCGYEVCIASTISTGDHDWREFDDYEQSRDEFLDTLLTQLVKEF